jgi:phage tail-like protein
MMMNNGSMPGMKGNATGKRSDPYPAYNFLVEIEGIIAGGFQEVTGLTVETTVDRRVFGGEHDREYVFITGTKYTDLTLKRGLSDVDALWKWFNDVAHGIVKKKNVSIILRDHSANQVMRWDFIKAFPIKWEGPSLNASSATIAAETVVLVHQGIRKE